MQKEIIQALAFSVPALCALVCLTIMLTDAAHPKKNKPERQLRLYLSLTYLVAALCWTGLTLEITYPAAFVHYHTVFLFTLMMDQVLIFRFVHIITATEDHKPFSRWHFAFPLSLTATAAISAWVVPFEERMAVIYNTGGNAVNPWFDTLHSLTSIVFIVYNILYPVLGLLRIGRYRRSIVDYSADTQRSSLRWLSLMLALTLLTIPVPLAGVLLGIDVFNNFWTSMQGVPPTFLIYLILCYNLLADNFVIIPPDNEFQPEKNAIIDPKYFSKYINEKKPFLNPKLKITDLCRELGTNRSYLSTFINKEYGMNFSRFINHCRLQEFERLLRLFPEKKKNSADFVMMAGFGNYRNYKQVKGSE
jgi:hypothetical protein